MEPTVDDVPFLIVGRIRNGVNLIVVESDNGVVDFSSQAIALIGRG